MALQCYFEMLKPDTKKLNSGKDSEIRSGASTIDRKPSKNL